VLYVAYSLGGSGGLACGQRRAYNGVKSLAFMTIHFCQEKKQSWKGLGARFRKNAAYGTIDYQNPEGLKLKLNQLKFI